MTVSEYFGSGTLSALPAVGERRCPPAQPASRGLAARVAKTVRYRFFIIAGVFPYSLGWAAAGGANWLTGILGLAAVVLVGLGIEGLNEYFDSRLGGDRVFASAGRSGAWWHLPLGLGSFAAAAVLAVCLATMRGWGVLVFALCGGAVALSYLMPPIRLSHRGLGEAAIAVGYGPGLTLGGFYLQAGQLGWQVAVLSLVPGLAMFAMALANEVPDYYGDRLAGKMNLIVRAGRRNGVILCGVVMALWFSLIAAGLMLGVFPSALGLCLLLIPVVFRSVRYGLKHCRAPHLYVRVIRTMIIVFVIANSVAIMSYVFH